MQGMRKALLVLAAVSALAAPSLASAAPAAIFSCQFTGQRDRIDPIVSPGVYPSAHVHLFAGGGPVTPTSGSADLLSKPTSCVETGDHAGYWIIQPEQGGVPLQPTTSKHVLVYYACRHSSSICRNIQWFPPNFGEVAGNSNATSAADNPILQNPETSGYRCGTGGGIFHPAPPATCSTVLVMGVTYGNCRFADGSTSMAVNTNCTGPGGTPIIRRQQYWRFKPVHSNLSDLTLNGYPTYQLHADILDAFKPETVQDFLDSCVHPQIACGQNPQLAG